MGFVLKYCATCGKRIPEEDMASGVAMEFNNRTYCRDHVPEGARRSAGALVGAAKRVGTSVRAAGSGSRAGALESKRNTGIRTSPGRSARISTPPPGGASPRRPSGHANRVEVQVSISSDSGTAQRRRPMPDVKKRSAAGPVMLVIALLVLGALGAVIAVAMTGGNGASPSNRSRINSSKSGANATNRNSSGTNSTTRSNGATAPEAGVGTSSDPRRTWIDELSRVNERYQRATAIDSQAEQREMLKQVWIDANDLVRTGPAAGVSDEMCNQAKRVRQESSEILGELLWEKVRPLVRGARDNYRLGDAYSLMTDIASGARDDLVPTFVTENPDLFPSFFAQFNDWLAECQSDFESFQALDADTKGFIDHLNELKQLVVDALRSDSGGSLNLFRMRAFLDRVEEVLGIYPRAEPSAIPRVGRFTRNHGDVFTAYARYWVEFVDNSPDLMHDREEAKEALETLEWLRDSHSARWFLTDDGRAGIDGAAGKIAGRLDVLRDSRDELAAVKADPDFDKAFRAFMRLDLFCTIRPMTPAQKAEAKEMMGEFEGLIRGEIEELKDATRAGQSNPSYVAAMIEYTQIVGGKSEFADEVARVSEWLNAAEGDPEKDLMAFGEAVQRQCRPTRQSQMYPHISWGFTASTTAAHGIASWVVEDRESRQYVPGTMQPSPATQLLNAILTRLVIDIDRDATLLLQTREDGVSAWIVTTRIDHILTRMLNKDTNPNEYRLLEQHRQQLETFAREPDE